MFSQILVSGSSPGKNQMKPGAVMLDLCEDVAQNLACIRHSGNVNLPNVIDEDTETEEAEITQLVDGMCRMAIRMYSA